MPFVPQHAYQFHRQRLIQPLEKQFTIRTVSFRDRPAPGMFAHTPAYGYHVVQESLLHGTPLDRFIAVSAVGRGRALCAACHD
jgi:hypothetical protein